MSMAQITLGESGGGGSEITSKQYSHTSSGSVRTLTTDIDFSQFDHVWIELVSSSSTQPEQDVSLISVGSSNIKYTFLYGSPAGSISGIGGGSLDTTLKVYGVNE